MTGYPFLSDPLHNNPREPNAILYEYIERLKSSSESSYLFALSSIRSILQPYAAQVCADWNSRPFVYYNEKSLKSLNNLLGFNTEQNEFALQFGDLFEPINRLCRHSISGQVPSEIAHLCSMIASLFSVHPRTFSGAVALESIALSLLHRPEFWFRTAGVEVLADLMEARHRVLTSLNSAADPLSPFTKIEELQLLIDAQDYPTRRSTWTRLLIRHFESLYENKAFDAISSRKVLLKATMKYLRDIQYMLYITPIVPLSSSPKIKLHPFLSSVELSSFVSSSPYACSDVCLSSTWMLNSSNPILEKLPNPSVAKENNSSSKKKLVQSPTKVQDELALDSRLIFYVLREGQSLIDELVHNPSADTIFGLIYITRFLRVFLEMNPDHLALADSKSSSEVPSLILRFTRQLCELVPPDCAGDTLIPEMTVSSTTLMGNGGGAGLSRRQLKRNSKRAAKLARRQASKQVGDDVTTRSDQDPLSPGQPARRMNHSDVLSHLLKQQVLQLVWTLAADGGAFEVSSFPLMIKDFSRSLASFFLTATGQEDSVMPALAFLNLASPALSWRWIHTIDFCLLYSARIQRLSSKRLDSLRCLIAPMVVTLACIVHRWCHRQIASFSTSKTPPRAPRIVVRAAGILVAFLHRELEKQRFQPSADIQSSRLDTTWIKATMDTFNEVSLPPGMENPLETLVSDLCDFVERESAESDANKSRWIWAAACLNFLAEIRCQNVCERMESSPHLCEAVMAMKDWTRSPTVLEDPLVNLPSPWTATYPSVKSWKCLTAERIYAQDGIGG
ncbi:hypothetical protein Aperf_G00000063799 [Anoplocephala perfoliata]